MFDKDVGVNWHLRFRLKLEKLEKEKAEFILDGIIEGPIILLKELVMSVSCCLSDG